MNKNVLMIFGILLCTLTTEAQTLLPMPQQLTRGQGVFRIDKGYQTIDLTRLDLTKEPMVAPWKGKANKSKRVMLFRPWGKSSNEGYRLRITTDSVVVSADNREGFLHAMATLVQWREGNQLAAVDITDEPAFAWRGVMIDLSRHIFPLSFLRKTIDNMSALKLNRLHLHLTDAGGWRLQINRYPRLTSLGAWRTASDWNAWWIEGDRGYLPEGTPGAYGGYFTQDEMRKLVTYARSRGVEVVPEIEMPGHSDEVMAAYPHLSCIEAGEGSPEGGKLIASSEFCPGNEETYIFLQNVLDEVMEVFPSHDIHVGGDEAGMSAWRSCVRCRAKMRAQGMTDVAQLQSYLMRRMARYLRDHGRRLVGWDEVIADSLGANVDVMVWRDAASAREAIRRGHRVVMAPSSHCYIQVPQDNSDAGTQSGYLPLEQVYSFDPLAGMTTEEARAVRGVQACVWTEYLKTEQEVEERLYPRLFAMAETGWNGKGKSSYLDFHERAVVLSDQLRAQGTRAFDLRHAQGDRPESREDVAHKARGCKVTYARPWNDKYAAQGAYTLTDGCRGGWSHSDGAWQGFLGEGDALDVTIDLGRAKPIRSVMLMFLHDAEIWVSVPQTLVMDVSDDGNVWRNIHTDTLTTKPSPEPSFHPYEWQGNAHARYVRVRASSVSKDHWLFTDEIIVR